MPIQTNAATREDMTKRLNAFLNQKPPKDPPAAEEPSLLSIAREELRRRNVLENENLALKRTVAQLEAIAKQSDEFKIWMREQFLPNLSLDERADNSEFTEFAIAEDYLERYLNVLDAVEHDSSPRVECSIFGRDGAPPPHAIWLNKDQLDVIIKPTTASIEPLKFKEDVATDGKNATLGVGKVERFATERSTTAPPGTFPTFEHLLKEVEQNGARIFGVDLGSGDECVVQGYTDKDGKLHIESVEHFDSTGQKIS